MILSPLQQDLAKFDSELIRLGESPRYWHLNALESWYTGQQYTGRPSFWDQEVPLRSRAPVIQSQFVRSSINRLANLVFGDRSFPRMRVEATGYRMTLSPSDVAVLQRLVAELGQCLALSKKMREVITEGLKCGSACILVSLCNGKPMMRLVPSKWCTPTFAADGSVESLVIEYKHPSPTDPDQWMMHRREITSTYDRVYDSVPIKAKVAPVFGDYQEVPVEFCPVIWVRNAAEPTATPDQIDGHALVDGLQDEVEALDMELSQLYRNALYNGDPQMVQIGVEGDASIAASQGPKGPTGDMKFSWFNSVLPNWAKNANSSGGDAVKKAPGKLWKLPQGGDAKLVESNGSGAEIIKGAVKEIRRVLTDSTGVVLFDADSLGGGDLAARTLNLMHAPMLDVADNLRVEYGDALLRLVDAFMHLFSGTLARTQGVLLRSYDEAEPVLARLYGVNSQQEARWLGPHVTLKWGDYFDPSSADKEAALKVAMTASGNKPLITAKTALASVATLFGIEDVEAELANANENDIPTP